MIAQVRDILALIRGHVPVAPRLCEVCEAVVTQVPASAVTDWRHRVHLWEVAGRFGVRPELEHRPGHTTFALVPEVSR